jgi:hypothetical protein
MKFKLKRYIFPYLFQIIKFFIKKNNFIFIQDQATNKRTCSIQNRKPLPPSVELVFNHLASRLASTLCFHDCLFAFLLFPKQILFTPCVLTWTTKNNLPCSFNTAIKRKKVHYVFLCPPLFPDNIITFIWIGKTIDQV